MTVTVPKFNFKPSWKEIKDPSENKELSGTIAQRIFSPMSGVFVDNPYSGEKEVMVGGLEDQAIAVKIYQDGVDKYSRAYLPDAATTTKNGYGHPTRAFHQGVGKAGGMLIIAGGTPNRDGSSTVGADAINRVFTIDAATKKVEALPEMSTPRAAPIVSASPDGRYFVVAGGMNRGHTHNEWPKLQDVIEIYDTKSKQWIDVEQKFPGLSKLPAARFGGSAVWVEDAGVERLVFVGGSTGTAQGAFGGFEASPPTQRIDVYDFKECKWIEAELPTPRMYPGVDTRKLPDRRCEIVVAGGGTGVNGGAPVDPQIYSVERIDPVTLGVSFGQHVPEQPAVKLAGNGSRDWSANALVFATGFGSGTKQTSMQKTSEMSFFFGFSKAFKGAALEESVQSAS